MRSRYNITMLLTADLMNKKYVTVKGVEVTSNIFIPWLFFHTFYCASFIRVVGISYAKT